MLYEIFFCLEAGVCVTMKRVWSSCRLTFHYKDLPLLRLGYKLCRLRIMNNKMTRMLGIVAKSHANIFSFEIIAFNFRRTYQTLFVAEASDGYCW